MLLRTRGAGLACVGRACRGGAAGRSRDGAAAAPEPRPSRPIARPGHRDTTGDYPVTESRCASRSELYDIFMLRGSGRRGRRHGCAVKERRGRSRRRKRPRASSTDRGCGVGRVAAGARRPRHRPVERKAPPAIGIIAVGQVAVGVVAIGQVAIGGISLGQASIGLGWGIGQLAFGLLAAGQVAAGLSAPLASSRSRRTRSGW